MRWLVLLPFALMGCWGHSAESPVVVGEAPTAPITEVEAPEPPPTPTEAPEPLVEASVDLSSLDEDKILSVVESAGWIGAIKPRHYSSDRELITVAMRTDDRAGWVLIYKGSEEVLDDIEGRTRGNVSRVRAGGHLLAVVLPAYPDQAEELLSLLVATCESLK